LVHLVLPLVVVDASYLASSLFLLKHEVVRVVVVQKMVPLINILASLQIYERWRLQTNLFYLKENNYKVVMVLVGFSPFYVEDSQLEGFF